MTTNRQVAPVVFGLITIVLGLVAPSAWAVPPEVSNLLFQNKQHLMWDAVSLTEGYRVYRGTLSGVVSGDDGTCLLGSVQGPGARQPRGT